MIVIILSFREVHERRSGKERRTIGKFSNKAKQERGIN
jgi:hypothetical protein